MKFYLPLTVGKPTSSDLPNAAGDKNKPQFVSGYKRL